MAFLFADSFDHYADADKTKKWTQYVAGFDSSAIVVGAYGDRSTNGMQLNTSGGGALYSGRIHLVPRTAPSGTTLIFGMRLKSVSAFTILTDNADIADIHSDVLFACRKSSSDLWWVRARANGMLSICRGSTVLGTSSVALTQGVFTYVEAKVILHGSTGRVTMRFNGETVIDVSGVNTTATGDNTWDEIRLGALSTLGGTLDLRIDDFYLLDGSGTTSNDFLGDIQVYAAFADADGSVSGWTPSTGSSHFALVDESSANTTDYNSTATLNAIDTLNFPNAPVVGAPIKAVQLVTYALKEDAGSAEIAGVTRLSSTNYVGNSIPASTSYAFLTQIWDVKPSDSSVWTYTDFNGAEFGYKKTV